MTISERMFLLLETKGLKQKDLADFLGINPSVVNAWKKRGTNPPIEYAIRICSFLNVNIFELLGEESKEQSEIEIIYSKLSPEDKQIVDIIFDKYKKETVKLSFSKIG